MINQCAKDLEKYDSSKDEVEALKVQQEELEDEEEILDLTNIKSLTFIKLVMLAGRMW